MRASTFFALIVAALLGLAAVGGARYMGWFNRVEPLAVKEPELPKILVAAKNLPPGYILTPPDVTVRPMTSREKAEFDSNPSKFLPAVPAVVSMRTPLREIEADQPILREYLSPPSIPQALGKSLSEGMRAVNVGVPRDRSAGGVLRVGDRVDVYLTAAISSAGDKGPPTVQTAMIARDLRIVMKNDILSPHLTTSPLPGVPIWFTLEANPYRAALIEFAKDRGLIVLEPISQDMMADGTRLRPPGSFSDPGSLEYQKEDERIAAILRGDRPVGDADLERIFRLSPVPLPVPPIRIETYQGNKKGEVAEFSVTVAKAARDPNDFLTTDQPNFGYRFSAPLIAEPSDANRTAPRANPGYMSSPPTQIGRPLGTTPAQKK